ncbi:hypothetical protein [uncultured Megamonas sp.]|uniref:hypothetical protein n=1 Tax=uncultured Megamonas sp. TaxID=286140 RepID=UPI00259B3944|nr:hypothetical protein [uncultured Megamonas sp.]
MIDPTGLQDLPDMVQLALMACDKPPKALAIELKCSISAVYQSLQGTRTLPASAMRKFAKLNLIASSAMAMQATGFKKLFKYRKSDRHIQSRLVELKIFDKRADEAMNMLPELLFDKNSPKDLTDEDRKIILNAVSAMMDRDNVALNLFMELDKKYKLDLVNKMR